MRFKRWKCVQGIRLTFADLHKASDNDDDESKHLGHSENVLYAGSCFHVVTVDESQQSCRKTKVGTHFT